MSTMKGVTIDTPTTRLTFPSSGEECTSPLQDAYYSLLIGATLKEGSPHFSVETPHLHVEYEGAIKVERLSTNKTLLLYTTSIPPTPD